MEFEKMMELIHTVSESNLTSFRYEEDGFKLCLKKENAQASCAEGAVIPQGAGQQVQGGARGASGIRDEEKADTAAAKADVPGAVKAEGKVVKSPLVGVFYTAPAEGAQPYVSVGDKVTKGQVLATVEAMKLMNEIESEYDGVIEEILAENGQGVGYGDPLFVIV